jgi:hypothetical protein
MKVLATIFTVVAILSITPLAHADTIDLGNSGWQAVITDPANVGILIDADTDNFVMIEIIKTFAEPPESGVFAPITIDFNQIAADGVTTALIVLNDEIITNNTSSDWMDYHWLIEGPAAFQISTTEASGFDVSPFTNSVWTPKAGWTADFASALNVDGGVVPAGSTFFPGVDAGYLVIQADLTEQDSSFTLSQNPTPEPATMLLLAAGLPILARRRRRLALTTV